MVELFKVLGDENRLRIVNILLNNELCVCELEVMLKLTQSNVSRHLGKLKNEGIIKSVKDAQWIHYMIDEVFRQEHKVLLDYLRAKEFIKPIYTNDNRRYESYKSNGYNCSDIRKCKESVKKGIEGKEYNE
jgi:ArsR family transcriptional regulator